MAAQSPAEVHRLFVAAFNAGDLDALLALYEPGATMIPEPGQLVVGREAVRNVLSAFLALKGSMTIETKTVAQAGDLALLHGQWTLTAAGPDGKPATRGGRTAEVVRRQPDGSWRYAIDDPYGE